MKAFTIDNEQNISFYESKKEAVQNAESEGSSAFSSQDELDLITTKMPLPTLVEIFNSFTGVAEVKSFPSRKAALSRIWAECRKMGKNVAPLTPTEEESAVVQLEEEGPDHTEAENNTVIAGPAPKAQRTPHALKATTPAQVAKAPKAKKEAAPNPAGDAKGPREGSKAAQVIEMLKKPGGATLAEIMKRFDWQQHTTRALLSAGGSLTKKHGITVKSEKGADGDRVFSISA